MEVYFRGGNTIRDLLVHPKDRDTILKKSGVIYRYRCGRVDCEEEYIGESDRTFGERYREHMRAPTPIMDHQNTTGHEVSLDNFSIVGREDNSIARNIKEAILIRVNDPIYPSTGTLASSSCHTSGMRCWQDHQNYISNNANNIRHGGTS